MNEITNCLARMFVYLLKVLSLLRLRKYEVGLAACIGLAVGSHTTGDYCKRGRARRRPYKAGHSLYGSAFRAWGNVLHLFRLLTSPAFLTTTALPPTSGTANGKKVDGSWRQVSLVRQVREVGRYGKHRLVPLEGGSALLVG
ncbi:hypothetical protein MGG_17431 [Pyricularia oryzae 70-15]|uniref:Uncharacterized protein n=3 Tax=Pyricularia oryzae TaxID=318829 RepID=G4NBH7_PYRO7|nr:uncharacterized protein MGG_17431 [Pyricularia oryzae 70-15]EHA48934.1 hypothetical protein MGG_17431 [Pyricularia oryzae 70-15]ELQ38880.1 hypothetical protein OOU_Y34scaffold00522g35 [Pyricularia oryzae Y34]